MSKCKNCGTEFDSAYCPACGTKREEAEFCPDCGTKREADAAFCMKCGHNFAAPQNTPFVELTGEMPRHDAMPPSKRKKLAAFYKIAPLSLFGILTLLMFAVYAAPIATLFGIGGENVYQFAFTINKVTFSEDNAINAFMLLSQYMSLLLPLAGVVIALTGLFLLLAQNNRIKQVEASGIVYCVLYIFLSVILMVQVGMLGYGIGAAPILMLVFSVLFSIGIIATSVLRNFFYKKYPEFRGSIR